MSGVAIVRYLLANNNGVLAQVPAARIQAGILPLATVLPAISLKQVSGISRNTVAMNSQKYLWTERVQVTVLAKDYPAKKTLLGLVRAALPLSRGTVNGFDCDSILDDIEGPDLDDAETGIYEQSQDYMVRFSR